MSATRHNAFQRLFRGETSYDFVGRWKRWFTISGIVILIGLISLATRGLNFSIEFKGGTVWEVPSSASVAHVRSVVGSAVSGYDQATITILTNPQTGQRTVKVEAPAKETGDPTRVAAVTNALAKMANVSPNDVQINAIGPSWGADITDKAIKAVIIFLVLVGLGMWLWFDAKMALAALVALIHDILVTLGIYSLSGFQVSPDTVIAFLTVLGYSLYDTIVVFDRVQENTRGLASSNRLTYSDVVNLSMNQVLARSVNTSLVAILPILSILVIGAWVLGATALQDFGLALFVGLTTGAYSSIFIASPLLALLKEREPRYAEIRRRLATSAAGSKRITPAAAATGDLSGAVAVASAAGTSARRPGRAAAPGRSSPRRPGDGSGVVTQDRPDGTGAAAPPDSPATGDQPATPPDEPGSRRPAGAGAAGSSGASGASGGRDESDAPGEAGAVGEPGETDEPSPARPPADAREPTPAGPAVPPRAGNRPPPRPRKKGRRR
jgi:preprotein translocase subunit SecF